MAKQPAISVDDLFNIAMEASVADPNQAPPPAVPWICDNFIDPVTGKLIKLESYQRRILRHALQMDAKGYSRYSMVIWSQIKKSGKTAIGAAAASWVANCIEQPNEVSCVANDQEQSTSRTFAAMKPTLERLGWNISESPRSTIAYNSNGSLVKAITTNYKGEAGGNQGLSVWSELWAYSGERLNRLWEELTPPPTRKFSMRFVETYAGFKQESLLLYGYYNRIFRDDTERELQPGVAKLWDDLPVYELEDASILVFWDHTPRMPWQTPEYYRDQRLHLRPEAYKRLHENRWLEASGKFITEEMWKASCRQDGPMQVRATYALDGSKNSDCTALVGCVRDGKVVHTTDVYIWEPKDGKEVDQNEVMQTIVDLHKKGLINPPLWYDPYQLVKMAQDLRKLGIPCAEFKQGVDRIKSDTTLYKLYDKGSIINWNHPGLRQHVLAASAELVGKDEEEYRIVKPSEGGMEESYTKVDACVAQSMAAYKAYLARSGGWAQSGL